MKQFVLFFVLSLICVGTICAADEYKNMEKAPELDIEGAYIIDLKPFRKKIEDNIAFVNMTDSQNLSFTVYYVDYNTGEWVKNEDYATVNKYNERDIVELDKQYVTITKKQGSFYEEVKVRRPTLLKKVPFIAIVPEQAGDYEYQLYPASNDIYISIVNAVIGEKHYDYQQIVTLNNVSKEKIYDAILRSSVVIFKNSSVAIEYKDENKGIIKGKTAYKDNYKNYHLIFTFEIRDNKYRATFDNFAIETTGEKGRKSHDYYNELEYNHMLPIFYEIVNEINKSINGNNDNW